MTTRIHRRALTATLALLAAGALVAATGPSASSAPEPIVIAMEGPLTGSQASNGIDMYRGVRLAVQQANARGGVLGRPVKLVRANDKADPDLALSVAKGARKAGAVAVVGPYNSSVGIVNLPYYVAKKIVPVQMTSTDDTTGLGVTVQPKNSQISPVEVAYLQGKGVRRVAMLVDPSAYTQGMADRLQSSLSASGVTVTSLPVVEGQADYTALVAQALATNPDYLYVSTYFPEGSAIAGAIAAANSTTGCFMGLANVDPAFITQAGLTASQRCVFSGVPEAAQMPNAKRYVAAYRKAFDSTPGVWGTFTYDSTNILFAAMEKSGTTNYATVLKALLRTKGFPGQTGAITIDPTTGNRTNVPVYILAVDDRSTFVITE
jgi:branched-chain amino acid transport system substrate-binding protein